jgi:predicted ribosome quality control (RQC) complex YloA/Tae2 family protein
VRLSAHPDGARLILQQGRVHHHKGAHAAAFDRIAAELGGSTLARIEQVGGDRLALLEFRDSPSGERRALVLELLGRHANLCLLGGADRILEVLIPQPEKGGRPPRLAPGAVWEPPGGAARAPREPQPSIAETWPEPEAVPPGPVKDRAPLSWRVECALGYAAEGALREDARRQLMARAKRRLDRARGSLQGLERRADAALELERLRQDGELLKSALGSLKRGDREARVIDWFDAEQPERCIPLDPKRSPQENLQRHFERVAKLETQAASLAEERARAEQRIRDLEELLVQAVDTDDPEALDAAAVERGLLEHLQQAGPRRKAPPAPRVPYRTYRSSDGFEIRVGRTARDNDALTLRHARGLDLWLHTADVPGSHVILRVERGRPASERAILEAALLAVHYSPARGAMRCPVHVVERKHVHKPKGAKPGLVTLAGGRTLTVRADPERLEALLKGLT